MTKKKMTKKKMTKTEFQKKHNPVAIANAEKLREAMTTAGFNCSKISWFTPYHWIENHKEPQFICYFTIDKLDPDGNYCEFCWNGNTGELMK